LEQSAGATTCFRVSDMPIESRTIVFSEEELKAALFDFCLAKQRRLPISGFAHLQVSLNAQIQATAGQTPAESITLVEHEIAAALIIYCKKHNIPLPRNSKKSLTLNNGVITLHVVKDTLIEQSATQSIAS
jgi:hypothetical protein